ncbi:MAG: hypothetical protein KGL39_40345 [Patescibacteria group bacterium]|nr:hypothetical protein [Patescibacteria group bacterium]
MRLLRPSIDMRTKLRVLCRQLGEMFPDEVVTIAVEQRSLGLFVRDRLARLAALLCCDVEDLHLDHDPALVNREKDVQMPDGSVRKRVVIVPRCAVVLRYYPDANDPEHLIYRVGGKTGSAHDVKTRVRGDHGQHSDLALARKNKKIEARIVGTKKTVGRFPRGRKLQGRPFAKVHRPMRRAP